MRAIRIFALALIAIAGLAGCDRPATPDATGTTQPPAPTPASTPVASAPRWEDVPSARPQPPSPPPPPPHNYAMEQDGTYGYEPALSEDDIRSGRAVKPLVMMRYVGMREGSYVILVLDQDNKNVATRMACQAPCNFATTQLMAGTTVLKTETIRVTHNSLAGGMFEDAMSGAGHRTKAVRIGIVDLAIDTGSMVDSDPFLLAARYHWRLLSTAGPVGNLAVAPWQTRARLSIGRRSLSGGQRFNDWRPTSPWPLCAAPCSPSSRKGAPACR